jgi:glycosyltransferase involved in cell wall biosynthesis
MDERAATGPVRLMAAALNLDDPRKGIRLILRALKRITARNVTLTLVGQASERLRERAKRLPFEVSFTGALSRSAVTDLMTRHDIFLFASRLDDWGYVLVEALAAGLWVIAPNQSPFDDIVGEAGDLFTPGPVQSLVACIERAVAQWQPNWRTTAVNRARSHFSRQAFAAQLCKAMSSASCEN